MLALESSATNVNIAAAHPAACATAIQIAASFGAHLAITSRVRSLPRSTVSQLPPLLTGLVTETALRSSEPLRLRSAMAGAIGGDKEAAMQMVGRRRSLDATKIKNKQKKTQTKKIKKGIFGNTVYAQSPPCWEEYFLFQTVPS